MGTGNTTNVCGGNRRGGGEAGILHGGMGGRRGGSGGLWLVGASDEVLIRRVAESGDERAMSELYDRYGGLVYGAGMRYLGDRGLAEDLVQDVFFAVWRSAAGFDP